MQVRSDVTRYRYGDEQHLEEALKRIFKYGQVLNQVSNILQVKLLFHMYQSYMFQNVL